MLGTYLQHDENIFAIPPSSMQSNQSCCVDPEKIPIVRRSSRRASMSASLDSLQYGVAATGKKPRQPRSKLLNPNPRNCEADEEKEVLIEDSDRAIALEFITGSQGCPPFPNSVPVENCSVLNIQFTDIDDHSTPSEDIKEMAIPELGIDSEFYVSCDKTLSFKVEDLVSATVISRVITSYTTSL